MDMKAILQAMDNPKPVADASDMKKFLTIVTEAADPHKVSLPVRMAIDHYAKPPATKKPAGMLDRYLKEAEDDVIYNREAKTMQHAQKANQIANRVRMQESPVNPAVMYNAPAKSADPIDSVNIDIPLLIRLLEYAREDASSDVDLHVLTDNLIKASKERPVLTMKHYSKLVPKAK